METTWLLPDKKIWYKIDDTFAAGTVKSTNNTKKYVNVIINNSEQQINVKIQDCFQRSQNFGEFEDMCNMNILNEPEILSNLKYRYVVNKIYTKIGQTLLVINPYKYIQTLYNKQSLMNFRQKVKNNSLTQNVIPHIYQTSAEAYNNLKQTNKKQAIVISGESGAGKTQNTKYCMRFLASLSHIHHHGQKQKVIQDIILQCNPILQSFGNSKTIRNSNSSRFGKYVKLFINDKQQMTGARIQNYLLQKSRVTSVSKKQRNFHIFYYLLNGTQRQRSGLLLNEKYEYLQSSGCMTCSGIDDKTNFKILKASLEDLGFKKQQVDKIWRILACILLVGNLTFDNTDNQKNQNNKCKYIDRKLVERICKHLELNIQELNFILLEQKYIIGKQIVIKKYSLNQCILVKNTLAKALYGRIFDYLIEKINERLWLNKKDDRSISILDIFGFQIFENNSLEQLCINFTNQRLHQLYIKYIFDDQILELKKDGLGDKIKNIIPPNNRPLIELIQKKIGISVFSLIDQKTVLESSKDQDIIFELRKLRHTNIHVDPQPNKTTFIILHSQNPVIYNIENFKYKNRDSVTVQITKLLNKLFPISQIQQSKAKTLVTKFDKQLKLLNDQLQSSQLHFIRCIKPNQDKKPNFIDDKLILQQIKYLGVLETIQIRKLAFPFRIQYQQFVHNFKDLITYDQSFLKLSCVDQCLLILRKAFSGIHKTQNSYLLGKQRLYLKEQMQQKLNFLAVDYYHIKTKASVKIQRQFIKYKQRRALLKGVRSIVNKFKILTNIIKRKIIKTQQIKQIYFKRYQNNIQKLKQQIKNQVEKKQKQRLIKTQQQKRIHQKRSQQLNVSDYETVLNDSISSKRPQQKLKQQCKLSKPQFQSAILSESYINHQSLINEDKNTLIKGQLKIPLYQNNSQNIQKLYNILTHVIDEQKDSQNDQLNISSSIDDKRIFQKQIFQRELAQKISIINYCAFYKTVLRQRKTLFGRSKSMTQILSAKDTPIKKSLISLSQQQQMKAIEVFKLLLWIGDSHKTKKVYQPIQKIIELSQNSTNEFKNEIFIQIIKQQNSKKQYTTIKMYQIMIILLHLFKIDDSFLIAYLSCLIQRYEEPKTIEKSKEYICNIIFKIVRILTTKQVIVSYMPTQLQLAALMCKRKIPLSVYFSIGNSILIKVESFQVLQDIKQRVIIAAGINSKRIFPKLFGFSQVMSFDNEELEENPLSDNRNIWDLLTYWEKAKAKFQETNVSSPQFALYIKIRYAFEVNFDDKQSVELVYAQTYFDLFLGRTRLSLNSLLQCSALMKACESDMNIDLIIPMWAVQQNKSKSSFQQFIKNKAKKYQNLTKHQIHFQFIKRCNQSPLVMSICFQTEGSLKLFLKPKHIYIVKQNQIIEQIGIRRILKWGCDQTTLILTIKQNTSSKIMTFKTNFAKIIGSYLSTSMQLIMDFKKY